MDATFANAIAQGADSLGLTEWNVLTEPTGNCDRREGLARFHALLQTPDGRLHKVTGGADLTGLHQSAAAFHRQLPDHSGPPGHHFPGRDLDLLWQDALAGQSLESMLGSVETIPRALIAWTDLQSALQATAQTSDLAAWDAEWSRWSDRFATLPVWSAEERAHLPQTILPQMRDQLRPHASSTPPVVRWSNGDFTTSNIIVAADGTTWLIDPEHAHATHFAAEDHVRLVALSETLRNHPGLAAFAGDTASPAEARFYNLRQLWLECLTNTPAYLDRVFPARRTAIFDPASSHPVMLADEQVVPGEQETAQLFYDANSQWNETQSIRVPYRRGQRQILVFPLPDSPTPLRLDPTSSRQRFTLHHIRTVSREGKTSDCLSLLRSQNLQPEPQTSPPRFQPLSCDPQWSFMPPPDAHWLVVEIEAESLSVKP